MPQFEFNDINEWLVNFERNQYRTDLRLSDVYALSIIKPLLEGFPYLPFTSSSIRPFNLAAILNDIIINRRKRILEFGAGTSTILISRLIRKNGLACDLISIEHDSQWISVLNDYLNKEELTDITKVIHAPLVTTDSRVQNDDWYDLRSLRNENVDEQEFDVVIIDGPPAYEANKSKSRYPAFPFILDKLSENAVVFLDNATRRGEQCIIEKWERDFQVKFGFIKTLAYYSLSSNFNPSP